MLSMIVAHDRNRGIGKNQQMPWHLPADLAFLKKTTIGKTIVMGRPTFEAIGKPLPKRRTIVLTSKDDFSPEGVEVMHAFSDALNACKAEEEWFVFGGSHVYEQALPYAERLYVTYIDEAFEVDRYFPAYPASEWALISEEKGLKNERNPYDYWFQVYERR